jgi:NADPH:quinone reductase-like Zn-dependent oxidoreductase
MPMILGNEAAGVVESVGPGGHAAATRLFGLVAEDPLRIEIGRTYPLRAAARAHRDMEGRTFAGSAVLIPESLGLLRRSVPH